MHKNRFVKFGIAHDGERHPYESIFLGLFPRCLEGMVRADGVRYVLLTLKNCRAPASVRQAIKTYNLANPEKQFNLLKLPELCGYDILTFSLVDRMHDNGFYREIVTERKKPSVDSTYWIWDVTRKAQVEKPKQDVGDTNPLKIHLVVSKQQKKRDAGWAEFEVLNFPALYPLFM